jgi:prepilin-type N-terminal cleavage/methylation domain-containing protein
VSAVCNPSYREGGFTLLEVLAVVVILAMATGVLATHFAVPTERAKQEATIAAVLDLDARARLLGKSAGGAALGLDEERVVLAARGQLVAEVTLDPNLELRLRSKSGNAKIVFDGAGRTESYRIEWTDGGIVRSIRICGDTGWHDEESRP